MRSDIRTYSSDEALVKARRMQIIRGANRVFVRKGYDRTNMRELAKACSMSMGALYHYVGCKEDILYLIIDHGMSQLAESVEAFVNSAANLSPTVALWRFIDMYYRMTDEGQDVTMFTYQETKNLKPEARQRVLDAAARDVAACEAILRRGIEAGEFSIDNPTIMAHNIVTGGHMWAVRRWFLRKTCSLEEYIREQTGSFLRAILVDERVAAGSRGFDGEAG